MNYFKSYNIIVFVFFLSFNFSAFASKRYVTQLGSGNYSGSSWGNASNNIQAMINASVDGDEVWVKHGTYVPYSYPSGCSGCSTNRDFTFFMKSGVKLYGQFAGNESSLTQRVLGVGETVLSGDLTNDGITTNNAYHVVSFVGIYSNSTTLDGFTVRNGNANINSSITALSGTLNPKTYYRNWGGGILFFSSRGRIINCHVVNNYATYGGGLLNSDISNPFISNSIFVSNSAEGGAAIYNHDNSSPSIVYTTIANNLALAAGGGIYNFNNSNPNISNTIIWNNTAPALSGIANNGGTPVVTYSIIQNGNSPCSSCPNTNGNINPLFKNSSDPNGPDNIWGTTDDGLELSKLSPAIEKAFGTVVLGTDVTGQVRHFDNPFRYNTTFLSDIGAYENHDIEPVTIYVNGSLTTGANNGTSWINAYRGDNALQIALATSQEGNQIWVAAGTYKPTAYPVGCIGCASNRDFAFHLKDGVKIYGGFAGNENNINQRFLQTFETRLDGDINTQGIDTDNVRHVIVSTVDGNLGGLDGLTILNGGDNASASSASISVESVTLNHGDGGGIIAVNSEISFKNLKIINNISKIGAGLFLRNSFSPISIENCVFKTNKSTNLGGGMYFEILYNLSIKKCIFEKNESLNGGAFSSSISSISIENSILDGNISGNFGGFGSAFWISQSTVGLNHCTITNNISNTLSRAAISVSTNCNFSINNSIIWGNNDGTSPTALEVSGSNIITADKSFVEGGFSPCSSCPGTNGNTDPKLVNISNALGPDNTWLTFDDGLIPTGNSPGLNAGSVVSSPDLIGDIRNISQQQFVREIGAYEFQPLNDCHTSRYIGDKPLASGTYQTGYTLLSSANVNTGNTVILETSREILLLPGFMAENGAIFTAKIGENCLLGLE